MESVVRDEGRWIVSTEADSNQRFPSFFKCRYYAQAAYVDEQVAPMLSTPSRLHFPVGTANF
jgi:hypothetical protein